MSRKILRFLSVLTFLLGCQNIVNAQDFGAIARVDPQNSSVQDGWFSGSTITLRLSKPVPFRVFHLQDPARLVLDIKQVDWSGLVAQEVIENSSNISGLRFGSFQGGWSRMVFELNTPMLPKEVDIPVDETTGIADLVVILEEVTAQEFAKNAGAPALEHAALVENRTEAERDKKKFLVLIDPGHGGIDPGAIRDGVQEKDLMLTLARTLAEALIRTGEIDARLTRNDDSFVSLPGRVRIAHQLGADLMISLHADALANGQARGATVYTLAEKASDEASRQLAEQHARGDILAGIDLQYADDEVAGVLIDLARTETQPRTHAMADILVQMIDDAGVRLSKKGRKQASFSVLTSADIPSVLLEVGFLSNDKDRANLRDPVWRDGMVAAIVDAITTWRADDLATETLVRQ